MRLIDSPARAVTRNECGGNFGGDSERRLVVSLDAGDLITVRPLGTRRTYRIEARDLFFHLLRIEANKVLLEKARERKAVRMARRQREQIRRTELRLFKPQEEAA